MKVQITGASNFINRMFEASVIAEDIKGETAWCGHCDCPYTIVVPEATMTVAMGLAR